MYHNWTGQAGNPHLALYDSSTVKAATPTRLGDEDMLQAFSLQTLHINHAHTIAVGFHKEQYYLMMVVDCIDFLWAAPSKSTSNLEVLI